MEEKERKIIRNVNKIEAEENENDEDYKVRRGRRMQRNEILKKNIEK